MRPIRASYGSDGSSDGVSKGYHYFAYGTDLSLNRMAKDFPTAQYVGRAAISNYRWIINENGTANIIRSSGNRVEGLVYSLSTSDTETLNETKSSRRFYAKHEIPVEVWEAPDVLYGCTPGDLMNDRTSKLLIRADRRGESIREHPPQIDCDILVYANYDSIEGIPSTKYADTINDGIRDAKMLGMTDDYVRRHIRQFVPKFPSRSTGLIGWETKLDKWREDHLSPSTYGTETRLVPRRKPRDSDWQLTRRPEYSTWVKPTVGCVRGDWNPRGGQTKTKVVVEQGPRRGRGIYVVVGKEKHKSEPKRSASKKISFGDWIKPTVSVVIDRRRR